MRKIVLGLFTALLAAGCGSSTKLSLSTSAGSGTSGAALTAGPSGELKITRVRMVVDRIKLVSVNSADDSSTDSPNDEVVAGPYLIDLKDAALDSGITQVFQVDAKAGTYKNLKFRIHKLDSNESQFPEMSRQSIIVEGTVNGSPFTPFTSDVNEEQKVQGTFNLADGQENNVTLSIDPSGWFTAADGTLLDPNLAVNNGEIRSKIEAKIKASIKAFDDHDRNGKRD